MPWWFGAPVGILNVMPPHEPVFETYVVLNFESASTKQHFCPHSYRTDEINHSNTDLFGSPLFLL